MMQIIGQSNYFASILTFTFQR